MKFKNTVTLVLTAVLLTLSLTACGSKPAGDSAASEPVTVFTRTCGSLPRRP